MTTVIFQVVRVAFFAEGADADEAKAAGADIVGGVELVEEIASNEPTLLATTCILNITLKRETPVHWIYYAMILLFQNF